MVKEFKSKGKNYTVFFENDCEYTDYAVYELIAEDGCCVRGNCGQEGLSSRIQTRLSEKASADFMKHVDKTGRFTAKILYQCKDEEKRYIIENYAILKKCHELLEMRFNKKIDFNVEVMDMVNFINDSFANKKLDRKENLRFFLTHPWFNINDYKK